MRDQKILERMKKTDEYLYLDRFKPDLVLSDEWGVMLDALVKKTSSKARALERKMLGDKK